MGGSFPQNRCDENALKNLHSGIRYAIMGFVGAYSDQFGQLFRPNPATLRSEATRTA